MKILKILTFLFLISGAKTFGSFEFLEIPPDAPTQINGFNPAIESSQDVFKNPSLILNRSRKEFFLGYGMWIEDITSNSFSLYFPFSHNLGFGISYFMTDYGKIKGYSALDQPLGNISAGSSLFSFGFGLRVFKIPFGISYSKISQKLSDEDEGSGEILNFGTKYRILGLDFGLNFSMPRGKVKYSSGSQEDEIPSFLRAGIKAPLKRFALFISDTVSQGDAYFNYGVEAKVSGNLVLRAGLESRKTIRGINFGFGITGEKFLLDFGICGTEFGKTVQNISFRYKFGASTLKSRLLSEAKYLFNQGYYIKAREILKEVLILDPSNKKARKYLREITRILNPAKKPSSKEGQ